MIVSLVAHLQVSDRCGTVHVKYHLPGALKLEKRLDAGHMGLLSTYIEPPSITDVTLASVALESLKALNRLMCDRTAVA